MIQKLDKPLEEKAGTVSVDPIPFARAVYDAFQRLCDEIRSNSALQKNFESYWDKKAKDNESALKRSITLDEVLGTGTGTAAVTLSAAMPPIDPKYRSK